MGWLKPPTSVESGVIYVFFQKGVVFRDLKREKTLSHWGFSNIHSFSGLESLVTCDSGSIFGWRLVSGENFLSPARVLFLRLLAVSEAAWESSKP